MTKNQIDYWNLQEVKRNNQRQWEETQKHNRNTEAETNRSNRAREDQARLDYYETQRSNMAREDQNRRNLVEQQRHSLATESEQQRSNLATEANNRFANQTNLILGLGQLANTRSSIGVQRQQADTARYNAYTQSRSVDEARRSNIRREQLTSLAQTETSRANRAQEALSAERNALTKSQQRIDFGNLKVNRERNLAQMQYNYDALREQMKYNEANLMINAGGKAVSSALDVLKIGALKKGASR